MICQGCNCRKGLISRPLSQFKTNVGRCSCFSSATFLAFLEARVLQIECKRHSISLSCNYCSNRAACISRFHTGTRHWRLDDVYPLYTLANFIQRARTRAPSPLCFPCSCRFLGRLRFFNGAKELRVHRNRNIIAVVVVVVAATASETSARPRCRRRR